MAIPEQFAEAVRDASAEKRCLRIRGGGTKDFYGVALEGEVLDTRAYRGIVDYDPSELVLTARAGTPLDEIDRTLAEGGQMLAFEPPHLGHDSTIGGVIAAGLSGPRRVAAGSARDFVLGVRVIDAQGRDLSFGGRVMKNVAGFDLSRLVTGSFGTLALVTEVSLKVLPKPETECTLAFEFDEAIAIDRINRWAAQPLPISASCHADGRLCVRLSGARAAVDAARERLGGEAVTPDGAFWTSVRDQTHTFFSSNAALWRLSIRSTTMPLDLGPQLIEWHGALRWVAQDVEPERVHAAAQAAGGHATLFRGGERGQGIQRLAPPVLELHKRVKRALDPDSVFGPHRIHPEF
ncbi:MAG: glycolate oxidase subunit GlcE [Betaproteobacteria bacterium]|nr:glycolate oxidase subunit GlcE [Betaproteobacteria bacterium]